MAGFLGCARTLKSYPYRWKCINPSQSVIIKLTAIGLDFTYPRPDFLLNLSSQDIFNALLNNCEV